MHKTLVVHIVLYYTDTCWPIKKNYKEGIKELDELDYIIRKHVKTLVQPLKLLEDFKPVLSKKEY